MTERGFDSHLNTILIVLPLLPTIIKEEFLEKDDENNLAIAKANMRINTAVSNS